MTSFTYTKKKAETNRQKDAASSKILQKKTYFFSFRSTQNSASSVQPNTMNPTCTSAKAYLTRQSAWSARYLQAALRSTSVDLTCRRMRSTSSHSRWFPRRNLFTRRRHHSRLRHLLCLLAFQAQVKNKITNSWEYKNIHHMGFQLFWI